jgi:hypothetical protein
MEAKDAQTIVNEIYTHMQKQGGQLSGWYVGITSDIEQRLFAGHRVPRKNHWYAYRKAINADEARAAEKAFLDAGCDGGTGGGEEDATYVYAYLKGTETVP